MYLSSLYFISICDLYVSSRTLITSALSFITLSSGVVIKTFLFADFPLFSSPCIITGDHVRADILLSTATNTLYIIQINAGFETNLVKYTSRIYDKYHNLELRFGHDKL